MAVDAPVLIEILVGAPGADACEAALREALGQGPVQICDVVLSQVCSSLRDGDQAMQVLEDMGVHYTGIEARAAIRAGEMQRRYRARNARHDRSLTDFLVGAHALLQCSALITHEAAFYRDYFKGLKVIVPQAT